TSSRWAGAWRFRAGKRLVRSITSHSGCAPPPRRSTPQGREGMAHRPQSLFRTERVRRLLTREQLARIALPVLMVGVALGLFAVSARDAQCGAYRGLMAAPEWFDPAFFQYNLLLALVAIVIVPLVTLIYARTMAQRKQ